MTSLTPDPVHLRGAVDLSSLVQRRSDAVPGRESSPSAGDSAPAGGWVQEGTDQNFQQIVELSNSVPVIVDLWAEWCEPCKQLTPVLEKVVAEYGGRLVLVTIDVDANPGLAQAFQAQSIPTVAAVIGGQPVPLFTGALPEGQVRDVLEQVLQVAAANGVTGSLPAAGPATEVDAVDEPPLPPLHQEAYDAIERGDLPAAIAAYTTALAQDPRDEQAAAGLVQVRLLDRLSGRTAGEIRDAAAATPHNVEAQLVVADLDVSGGHVADAFDRLLGLFPRLDQAGKDAVRTHLLELFQVVGADDERVAVARRRLTALLY